MNLHSIARTILFRSGLWRVPVRVRSGVAEGARWTFFPYSAYWRGTHEPVLQAELLQLGGGDITGWTCWDVGAHFGLYSIGLARRVGPAGSVVAFEPDPVSFRRLELHRRMNRCENLQVYEAAASARSGNAEVYTYGTLGTTTTHLPYDDEPRFDHVSPLPVRLVAVDDLVAANRLTLPNFVKIDAEGHGHHVLEGMQRALEDSRPVIIMGFHSQTEISGALARLRGRYVWRRVGSASSYGTDDLSVNADYRFEPVRT